MAASIAAPPRDSRLQTLRGRNPLRTTLAFRQDPLRFLLRLSQQCGDVSQWRLFTWPVYHVNHPDFVKHILQANYLNSGSQPIFRDMHQE